MRARRTIILLLAVLSLTSQKAGAQSVTDWFDSMVYQPVDTIMSRVDSFIAAMDDSTRATAAGLAFDYYSTSPIMGHESVAVHVADRWFLSGELKWSDESSYPLLYSYAEANRSSLIGCRAPELVMESIDGASVSLRGCTGRNKVLYFYDNECSTCRRMTPALASLASAYDGEPITLVAVYTQSDKEAWKRYVAEQFGSIDNDKVQIVHLWDPEVESGYHMKYGLLTTPGLFLIDSQNIIVGRKLDADALAGLLEMRNGEAAGYRQLFDEIFASLEPVGEEEIALVADSFCRRTEADSALFRESFYELYDYLRSMPGYQYQAGAVQTAEKYILGRGEYWSQEFLSQIGEAVSLFNLNPLGAKATNLKLQTPKGCTRRMLRGSPRYTVLFFHLVRCGDCQAEAAALREMAGHLKEKGVRVICIYTGSEERLWRDFVEKADDSWTCLRDAKGRSGMHSLYDIGYVPKIYLLDRDRSIIAKDINAESIKSIIQ